MNQDQFLEKVKKVADRDTSFDPNNWSPDNSLWGHCVVVSLLAQDYFGGDLIRGSLENFPEFYHLRSHYWNKFSDGKEVDFTGVQFGKSLHISNSEVRARENVLFSPDTQKRYSLLRSRFEGV